MHPLSWSVRRCCGRSAQHTHRCRGCSSQMASANAMKRFKSNRTCKHCKIEIACVHGIQPVSTVAIDGWPEERLLFYHGNCWPTVKARWAKRFHVQERRIRYAVWPSQFHGNQICDSESGSSIFDVEGPSPTAEERAGSSSTAAQEQVSSNRTTPDAFV